MSKPRVTPPLLLLAAALAFAPSFTAGRGVPVPTKTLAGFIDGEVIVRFKADSNIVRKHALAAAGKSEGQATAAATKAALAARAGALGARTGLSLEAGRAVGERIQVVRQRGADAAELARRIAADPDVEWAEPNGRKRRLQAVPPNDLLYPAVAAGLRPQGPAVGQWYLRAPDATVRSSIDAEAAWSRGGYGSPNVVVAVLDTGVRFEHPDLAGRLLAGRDFVSDAQVANDNQSQGIVIERNGSSLTVDWDADAADPGDWTTALENSTVGGPFYKCDPDGVGAALDTLSSWHGTTTSSVIAANANDANGMAGVAPGSRVLPVRVLGKCYGSDADIQAAMRWAAGIDVPGVPRNATPAKVINLSLGSEGACSDGYRAAVNEVTKPAPDGPGAVIVASAGNSTGHAVGTPANCPGVIAVAALRHVGSKVGFSDVGPQISVSAPGGNCVNLSGACLYPIITALNLGDFGPTASGWSDSFNTTLGTSYSAPLVAGVAALMFAQNDSLTPAQVKSYLEATARPFPAPPAGDTVPMCPAIVTSGDFTGQCHCPNRGGAGFPQCGAGMLDAGAAVAGVLNGVAQADASPAAPVVGNTITLSSSRSLPAAGRTVSGWTWSIVDTGGAISGISGSANLPSISVNAIAVGTAVVELTTVDSGGARSTTRLSINVAATPPPSGPANPGDSGGGAVSLMWLALLVLAALALAKARPARP